MIPSQNHFDIAEIKARVKIWDVLRHFGHEVGEVCKAVKSPLRDEKHPSFSIFDSGGMAKDHATGESYDCILLYMALAGCNKHEAIVACGKLAGLSPGVIPPAMSVPPPPRSTFLKEMKAVKESLRDQLGAYTPSRKEEMIARALRYLLPEARDNILLRFCDAKNLSLQFMKNMVKAGLVGVLKHPALRSPAIAWLYDNPHFGPACKLRMTAESSRMTMWWVGKSQEHLFGEQLAHPVDDVRRERQTRMLVLEGESDVLTMLQLGIPAVGVPGAGVIPDHRVLHYTLAFRYLAIVYDNDPAGRKAAIKIHNHILQHATGCTLFNGILSKIPDGMDIGECWVKWGEKFSDYAKSDIDRMQKHNETTTANEQNHE